MSRFRRGLLLIFILLGAYAVSYQGETDGNLDFFHEGDRLAHMDTLWSGGLPYRDIYVQQGLGENILKPWLACRLWGRSVASLRRLGQNAYLYRGYLPPLGLVATLFAVYALTRSLMVCAATAIFLLTGWYEITERHAMGMLAIAAIGAYLHSSRQHWLLIAGVFSGLAAVYSLEVGLYCTAAIVMWLLLDAQFSTDRQVARKSISFLAGALLPLLVLLAWCVWRGLTRDFFFNLHAQLFMRSDVVPAAYPLPDPASGWGIAAQRLIFYYLMPAALPLGLLAALRSLRSARSQPASALLLTSLLGMCFWMSVWSRPDIWHVAYTVGPFALFGATLYVALWPCRPTVDRRIWIATPVLISLIALLSIGSGGAVGRQFGLSSPYLPPNLREPRRDLVTCPNPRLGGVRIGRVQAAFVTSIVGYIHEHTRGDQTILDLSDLGLIYFLAERRSPTRFHLLSHVGDSNLRLLMLEEAGVDMPGVIIRRDSSLRHGDDLDDFISEHYRHDAGIGTLQLWLRKQ